MRDASLKLPDDAVLFDGAGARIKRLTIHCDERGGLWEVWRADWEAMEPKRFRPAQVNLSASKPGVLRGMHWHRLQTDIWHVLKGELLVQLSDQRPWSKTRGQNVMLFLDALEPSILMIRPGVVHGFYAIKDSTLCYLVDNTYVPENPDEYSVRWDDPGLGLDWTPGLKPTLSKRDAEAPALCDYEPHQFAPPDDE